MRGIFSGIVHAATQAIRGSFRSRVRPFGLYYDDLLVITPDVEKALSRLPDDVKLERSRRIKRAMDLSAKKKELPKELQDYDPLEVILFI
jgi:hypothetical protein